MVDFGHMTEKERKHAEYVRNKDRYLAAAKRRREADPERHLRENREWAQKNPERVKASREKRKAKQSEAWKVWYAKHKDEFLNYCRERYRKNPERFRAQTKAWAEANKQNARYKLMRAASTHRRRSRMVNAGASLSGGDLQAIIVRDRNKCYLCGKIVSAGDRSFDHVIPLAKGGTNEPANIALTHLKCNISKGSKIVRLC